MRTATLTGPGGSTAKLHIPDGATEDQIGAAVEEGKRQLNVNATSGLDSYQMQLGDAYDKRRAMADKILDRWGAGEQGAASTIVQMVGKAGAGGFLDFIGETIVAGGKGVVGMLPDHIEDPLKKTIAEAGVAFMQTDMAQEGLSALEAGMDVYGTWKDEHPVGAANLEAVVDIGMVAVPVRGKPTTVSKTGAAIKQSGRASATKTKRAFAESLATPYQSAKVQTEQVARTEVQGLLRKNVVSPTRQQQGSIAELMSTPIKKNQSLQQNYNIIAKEVNREAKQLQRTLDHKNVRIGKSRIDDALAGAQRKIHQDPAIVGDARRSAEAIDEVMKQIIADSNAKTAGGLLRARKSFDHKFIREGRGTVLDPRLHNAQSVAVREYRQAINNLINRAVPEEQVLTSLGRQHRLLNVLDDLSPKVAKEYNNAISRGWQRAMNKLPLRGELSRTLMATGLGFGAFGLAAKVGPAIVTGAAIGGAAWAGGRVAVSPTTRKALGQLVKTMGRYPEMRAERALIMEVMQSAKASEGEPE